MESIPYRDPAPPRQRSYPASRRSRPLARPPALRNLGTLRRDTEWIYQGACSAKTRARDWTRLLVLGRAKQGPAEQARPSSAAAITSLCQRPLTCACSAETPTRHAQATNSPAATTINGQIMVSLHSIWSHRSPLRLRQSRRAYTVFSKTGSQVAAARNARFYSAQAKTRAIPVTRPGRSSDQTCALVESKVRLSQGCCPHVNDALLGQKFPGVNLIISASGQTPRSFFFVIISVPCTASTAVGTYLRAT